MPSFISDKGVWKPAKEKTYIDFANSKDPVLLKAHQEGKVENHMYEGPDRQAEQIILEKTGSKHGSIGMDSRKNPENIMKARQLGMTVEEWLQMNVTPTAEELDAQAQAKEKVVEHKPPAKKPGVQAGSGGFGEKESYLRKL